jgi:ParB family chromosome partitioning protein
MFAGLAGAQLLKEASMKTDSPKTEPKKPDPSSRATLSPTRQDVPLERITPDPDNRRIDESEEDFSDLADSIRVFGVLDALKVQRRTDGSFPLIDGHRRYLAARHVGLKTVPCDVWPEGVSERDLLSAGFILNHHRKEHSCLAVAKQLRRLKNQYAETHEQLAARLGVRLSRVKSYLALLSASDQLLAFLESTDPPLQIAVELFRYEKALGEVECRSLLRSLRERPLTGREVETLRKRAEAKRQPAETEEGSEAKRPRGISASVGRVVAALRRDPIATAKELEAALLPHGFRLIPVAGLPTNSAIKSPSGSVEASTRGSSPPNPSGADGAA